MTDHTISANLKAVPGISQPEQLKWKYFYRNFNIDPDGRLTIKNFHPEFRDKLAEVLMDESLPFQSILPISG